MPLNRYPFTRSWLALGLGLLTLPQAYAAGERIFRDALGIEHKIEEVRPSFWSRTLHGAHTQVREEYSWQGHRYRLHFESRREFSARHFDEILATEDGAEWRYERDPLTGDVWRQAVPVLPGAPRTWALVNRAGRAEGLPSDAATPANTPLRQIQLDLVEAAAHGDASQVAHVLKLGANTPGFNVDGYAFSGATPYPPYRYGSPLLIALEAPLESMRSESQRLAVVRALLKAGADPRYLGASGETAVNLIVRGAPDAVRARDFDSTRTLLLNELLSHKGDVRARGTDTLWKPALVHAVESCTLKVATQKKLIRQLVAAGANPDEAGALGTTARAAHPCIDGPRQERLDTRKLWSQLNLPRARNVANSTDDEVADVADVAGVADLSADAMPADEFRTLRVELPRAPGLN